MSAPFVRSPGLFRQRHLDAAAAPDDRHRPVDRDPVLDHGDLGAAALPLLALGRATPTPGRSPPWSPPARLRICNIRPRSPCTTPAHPVAAIAPNRYTGIVWALAIDAAWFAVTPSPAVLLGAAVVIAAAVLVLPQGASS